MQRRTLLQILTGTAVALFAGVGRAIKVPVLPAVQTVKRGISAMPFVKILDRPEKINEGVYVVARMAVNSRRGPTRLSRAWNPDVDRTTTLKS